MTSPAPVPPPSTDPGARGVVLTSRQLVAEVVIVLWVSLGAAAVRAVLTLLDRLTTGVKLADQTAQIIAPVTPDRPWLDLLYQLSFVVLPLGAVALVGYLLHRSGESFATIGFDLRRPGSDVARGAALAAVLGGAGLIFFVVAHRLGINAQVAAAQVGGHWWDWPVLLLQAAENAVLEEVVVLGFVLHRLAQLGVAKPWAIAISAAIRGTYHLYQGVGAFIGNAVMGIVFGWLFYRWRRVGPMIVAHFLIDAVAFVGYAALAGRVDWLP